MVIRGSLGFDPSESFYDQLVYLMNSGKYEEVIDLFQNSIESNDANASKCKEGLPLLFGHILMGPAVTASQQANYQDLLRYANCILRIGSLMEIPPNMQALGWYFKGVALGSMGNADEAINCFDKTIQYEPVGPTACEAWRDRGGILYNNGRYEDALYSVEQGIKALTGEDPHFRKGCEDLKKLCLQALGSRKDKGGGGDIKKSLSRLIGRG